MHTIKNEQYVHKKSRLYNNAGGSKPKVSPRNTRHEKAQQTLRVFLAGVLLRTCHSHIPPAKIRRRIFIRPVPSNKTSFYGNMAEQRFGFYDNSRGVGTGIIEISQSRLGGIDEGKPRGHVPR